MSRVDPIQAARDAAQLAALHANRHTARNYAKLAMRKCPWLMIDRAVMGGWSRSLEDIISDCVRRHLDHTGKLPSMGWIAEIRIPDSDLSHYDASGHAHNHMDADDIKSARTMIVRRSTQKDMAAGECE